LQGFPKRFPQPFQAERSRIEAEIKFEWQTVKERILETGNKLITP